jgi:tryptophanyl-tRNA synthetase
MAPTPRPRVLSGMRPTGKLHLGNYMGALANWVKLQQDYECYFFIADLHALTTDYADPSRLKLNTLDVALDWLAAGLEPEKSTIFIQSHVPQHAELHLLFSMITPLGWLERVPTYKEQQENIKGKDLTTYGFLGYPLLQSADILLYQPQFVPVGQDQVAHVELTREVARRFNSMYKTDVFPEPEALLTPSPKLPGTDGRKMSKSYGNTIGLTDAPLVTQSKVLGMSTNGQRTRQTDSGEPDLCPVGDLHSVFSSRDTNTEIRIGCRSAAIGCVDCKLKASSSICKVTEPIFEKRQSLQENVKAVWQTLLDQSEKATLRAEESMRLARSVLDLGRNPDDAELQLLQDRMTGPTASDRGYDFTPYQESWGANDSSSDVLDINAIVLVRMCWQYLLPSDIWFFVPNTSGFSNERVFEEPFLVLSKKKRVFATAALEVSGLEWHFDLPAKSYEVWALLCGIDEGRRLIDFIIPQRYYAQPFAAAKKFAVGGRVKVTVTNIADRFALKLADSGPIDITDLLSNYEPLR